MDQFGNSKNSSSPNSRGSNEYIMGTHDPFEKQFRSPGSATTEESVEELLIIPESDLLQAGWSPNLDDVQYLSQLISSPFPHTVAEQHLAIQDHIVTLKNRQLTLSFNVPAVFSGAFTDGQWIARNMTLSEDREKVSVAEDICGHFTAPLSSYITSEIKVEPTILVKNNEAFDQFLNQHVKVESVKPEQDRKRIVTAQISSSTECNSTMEMKLCSSTRTKFEGSSLAKAIAAMEHDADESMETQSNNTIDLEGESACDHVDDERLQQSREDSGAEMDPLRLEFMGCHGNRIVEINIEDDSGDATSTENKDKDLDANIVQLISPSDTRSAMMSRNPISMIESTVENTRNLVFNAPGRGNPENEQRGGTDDGTANIIQEEYTVRRSTRVRKVPQRYADVSVTESRGRTRKSKSGKID